MRWLFDFLGFNKARPKNAITATLQKTGSFYTLRIGGVLNKATVDRIQSIAAKDISKGGSDLKVMIVLSNFQGWKTGDNWGDVDFFVNHEAAISKIAVVGDRKWEEESLLFLGAGRRSGEVRYFDAELEPSARAWLDGVS